MNIEQKRVEPTATAQSARRERVDMGDPQPVAQVSRVWRTTSQVATIGIFVILLIGALEFARPLLLPLVSAFVVTMMLGPLSARAERAGIPSLLTAIVLWLMVIGVVYGVIVLLAGPAIDWIGRAPEIGKTIQDKLHVLDRPWEMIQDLRKALMPGGDTKPGVDIAAFIAPMLSVVTPAIGEVFIFFGTLFFMLIGRTKLRRVMVAFFEDRDARLRTLKIMNDIEQNLTSYLSMVTVINFVVGIAAGVIAWAVGLPNPFAWAVLGFILNFLPYIGALMMEAAFFLAGLVAFSTLTHALAAPLLFVVFATLEGHFITPALIGQRLTLNPLTVFISLVFWSWLWGPVGAFLAVPLLIMGLVAVNHLFPDDEQPALPE